MVLGGPLGDLHLGGIVALIALAMTGSAYLDNEI